MSNLIKIHGREDHLPNFFNHFFGNEFFDNTFDGDMPAINVKEDNKGFYLEVSVPGYSKEDFNINVDNNLLTISGKKSVEKEEHDKDCKILRQEFSSESFSRSFTLPEHINTSSIEAKQKDGVLRVTLPKLATAKEDKVRKIEIK